MDQLTELLRAATQNPKPPVTLHARIHNDRFFVKLAPGTIPGYDRFRALGRAVLGPSIREKCT